MSSQGIDNYYDLYLNEETSRYVYRIMAIKYVMQSYYEKKAVIDKLIGWVYEIPNTQLISVWQIDDLALWASENWYKYKDIKTLNRWIVWDSLPDWVWDITTLQN